MDAISEVDKFTDELVKNGSTYYAVLNSFWPWKNCGKISEENMVETIYKKTWEVSAYSGTYKSLKLNFLFKRSVHFNINKSRLYLFDMDTNRHIDITEKIKAVDGNKRVELNELCNYPHDTIQYTLITEKFLLPKSGDLRITLVTNILREEVTGVFTSFPALWKPDIIEYYKSSLKSFKKAYAKKGLRGMMYADEINSNKCSILFSENQTYVNFDDNDITKKAYSDWLKRRFNTIEELNKYVQADFVDFKDVRWYIPIYPYLEKGTEEKDILDGSIWDDVYNTFGPFSPRQLRKIDKLQEEFRIWFYGYWLAEYGKMAKEVIGNVPVFIASAGIKDGENYYLQIHKHAMVQGIDGLIRNHFAWVGKMETGTLATFFPGSKERFPLENVLGLLNSVQKESEKTKTYFANEFGWFEELDGVPDAPLEDEEDERNVVAEQFSTYDFKSKEDLRNFLIILIENGYKGFNMADMVPDHENNKEQVKWLLELKDEILRIVVQ